MANVRPWKEQPYYAGYTLPLIRELAKRMESEEGTLWDYIDFLPVLKDLVTDVEWLRMTLGFYADPAFYENIAMFPGEGHVTNVRGEPRVGGFAMELPQSGGRPGDKARAALAHWTYVQSDRLRQMSEARERGERG